MKIIKNQLKNRVLEAFQKILVIFYIFFFRGFQKKTDNGNVVIISFHKLGDTVFTIPAVTQIFKKFTNKKVYILTFKETGEIYKIKFDKGIIPVEKNYFLWGGRIASKKVKKILKNLNPEIIFDITGTIASASLIISSNAKDIIGLNKECYKSAYKFYTPIRNKPHLIDRYLDIVRTYVKINDSEIEKEFPVNYSKSGRILIHPFAGWKAKEWGLEKYIKLAEKLNKSYNVEIICEKNILPEDIQESIAKSGISICFTESVTDLINELRNCSLLISNDTGPVYIAALLGKSTFTIYGPTNPGFSIPFGISHQYINKILFCSPAENYQYCFTDAGRNGCPSNECMKLLQVEEVANKVDLHIKEIGLEKKSTIIISK